MSITRQEQALLAQEELLFQHNQDASFWIGIAALEGDQDPSALRIESDRFRAKSYIDEHHFLPPSVRNDQGGESDDDDIRSTHFVVLENQSDIAGQMVGTMRAIRKRHAEDRLPVEQLFPEAFVNDSAPIDSIEASRFIASHPDKLTKGAISLALIRAIVSRAVQYDQTPIYAVVEAPLERRFGAIGLPFVRIAAPKPLAEYDKTINMALRFYPHEIFATSDADVTNQLLLSAFFKTARQNAGLGFYDNYLLTTPPGIQSEQA